MERPLSKVSSWIATGLTIRAKAELCLIAGVFIWLIATPPPAAASTSSEFGLSPLELGRLQTPHSEGNQLFSHPTALADYETLTLQGFLTGRYFSSKPEEPTAHMGAAIYIPLASPHQSAWLAGLGFGLGNPVHGLFRAMGSTTPTTPEPQSTESLDLRTTLNSRPHPNLDLAIGLRSLAKLVGSIDVTVADAGNQTFVINRLLTTYRAELEARWSAETWAIQLGYRDRLVIDYDVPIQASLEDPVPLDLPLLSIRGVAFIDPRTAWVAGYSQHSRHTFGWQLRVRLSDAENVGLSGLTPSEKRPLPNLPREWLATVSVQPDSASIVPFRLNHAYGVRLIERDPHLEVALRAGISAEYQFDQQSLALGCSVEVKLNLKPTTLVCSLGVDTPWEPPQ